MDAQKVFLKITKPPAVNKFKLRVGAHHPPSSMFPQVNAIKPQVSAYHFPVGNEIFVPLPCLSTVNEINPLLTTPTANKIKPQVRNHHPPFPFSE